jgi:hypothetical protein
MPGLSYHDMSRATDGMTSQVTALRGSGNVGRRDRLQGALRPRPADTARGAPPCERLRTDPGLGVAKRMKHGAAQGRRRGRRAGAVGLAAQRAAAASRQHRYNRPSLRRRGYRAGVAAQRAAASIATASLQPPVTATARLPRGSGSSTSRCQHRDSIATTARHCYGAATARPRIKRLRGARDRRLLETPRVR